MFLFLFFNVFMWVQCHGWELNMEYGGQKKRSPTEPHLLLLDLQISKES